MFLNGLKRGNFSSSKKLRIKTTIRIVHTTSMHKQLMTTFKIHSPPTNNSVDNIWKREHTGSHFVQKIRKLSKQTIICLKALRYQISHEETLPHSPTPSITIWILETSSKKNPNLFETLEFQTIKRKCWLQQLSKSVQPPSTIEHSNAAHKTILNHCLITLSDWMSSTEITVARPILFQQQ